ncbi:MAG: hypothetical protein KatS3mg058_1847 [Roseiflexus sp.]|nr:MAG: hypothetical protein KatS3mg058_1847 [Roseiflexus sp.]
MVTGNWYDWVRIPLQTPLMEGWSRWLLLRRSVGDPSDITARVCVAPSETTLQDPVQVARRCRTMEACFEAAKGEVGLDHDDVRSWQGWHRHITLACLARAFLAVMRAQAGEPSAELQKGGPPNRPSILALSKRNAGCRPPERAGDAAAAGSRCGSSRHRRPLSSPSRNGVGNAKPMPVPVITDAELEHLPDYNCSTMTLDKGQRPHQALGNRTPAAVSFARSPVQG